MKQTNILLVDDHAVVRKGLISLLEDEQNIKIIGDVAGGEEALEFAAKNLPDLLLLDLNMPNMSGIETAKRFSKQFPSVKKLVFSMHNNAEYILNSVENGVDGYLLKDCDKEEILEAIETVSGGDRYFPQSVSAILVGALQNKNKKPSTEQFGKVTNVLSKKETQILKLIAEGNNSKNIADKLDLSIRTVSNHRANMLKKTNLNNTAELVRMASKEGL